MKHGKRYENLKKDHFTKEELSLKEGVEKAKNMANAKFDETLEVSVKLGIDPRKSDQLVRGSVVLPHGTGRKVTVLVFASGEKAQEASAAGADYVGTDEYIEKIQKEGWLDFNAVVAVPQIMGKVGMLGKILGPRGLMPNPKLGTVTMNVKEVVEEIKKGRIEFKNDKSGNINVPVGKTSFSSENLLNNVNEFLKELIKSKPAAVKGTYIKSVYISPTMGPSVKINAAELVQSSH
ncbi:50S ribosomal protein L1 [candidate division WOR-3 bacterium]|nr:50S ribosomal protein L1 [candidate division WOR-3 bacterium]